MAQKDCEETQMSCAAEMTAIVRDLSQAQQASKLDIAWADVARKLKVTPRRVRDHWYGKAKTIHADELLRARELKARQAELNAQREARLQAQRLLMVAHRLEEEDAHRYRSDINTLKQAATLVGVHDSPLAEE